MKRTLTTPLMLSLGLATLAPWYVHLTPTARGQIDDAPPAARRVDGMRLESVFTGYELVDLEMRDASKLNATARRIGLRLGDVDRELELVPHDLRAPSYRATFTTGEGVVEEPARPVTTYRGKVAGVADSDVRILIQDDMVLGYVRTAADRLFVESASLYEPDMPPGRVVVYRDADIRPEHRGQCGSERLAAHAGGLAGRAAQDASEATALSTDGGRLRLIEIATDADFEFFQARGTSSNSFILGIINQVDGIYRSELRVTFTVTFQNVFTDPRTPYSSSNSKKLLKQFRIFWTAAHKDVQRDVAHLFTGKDMDGTTVGRAYVGELCDGNFAYGVNQNLATGEMVKLVAHELGHNIGADHDGASLCPETGPDTGPLMCPSIQQLGPNVFSEDSKGEINFNLALRGCDDILLHSPADNAQIYTTDGTGTISALYGYENFRETWATIVPGNFGGDSAPDLLFYDPAAGTGEFYTTDGEGHLTLLSKHTNWNETWDLIVPGNFNGDEHTDLLFYDREAGLGSFWTTDGAGGVAELQTHDYWRRSWDIIVPGEFGGDGHTDLLLYDRAGGTGEFYSTDGGGGIALLQTHDYWRPSWDLIVPGSFGGGTHTDLLFYDRAAGTGEFYATDGGGGIWLLQEHHTWRTSYDIIVPGEFGGDGHTDLLLYDRAAGTGEFVSTDGWGSLLALRQYTDWRTSWYAIVPGNFGDDFRTDLLFYQR